MKNEFNRAGPVLHLLLRYTQALITQMAQTAACNSLDRQLCPWLLLRLDRLLPMEPATQSSKLLALAIATAGVWLMYAGRQSGS